MGHMEIFDALDAAYTDCYYRKGIEEYIVAQKDLNLLKKLLFRQEKGLMQTKIILKIVRQEHM